MGYMGESASNSLVYASQNEMNVMLNDLNANNKVNIALVMMARSQKNQNTLLDGQTLALDSSHQLCKYPGITYTKTNPHMC